MSSFIALESGLKPNENDEAYGEAGRRMVRVPNSYYIR
jgi:hypothetical protein